MNQVTIHFPNAELARAFMEWLEGGGGIDDAAYSLEAQQGVETEWAIDWDAADIIVTVTGDTQP
jgi:ornithine cyclodeaminase/alanine dehydrogenase-like protein (mu-crystallin family)